MNKPIASDRITELKKEAEFYADKGKERATQQARRDLDRWREVRDAELGGRMRNDLDRDGFLYIGRPATGRRGG
jgi:hypothetical protein